MGKVSKIACYGMGGLFLFGAAVQWNDPDPLAWIALYLVAAIACFGVGRGAWARFTAAACAVSAIAWGARIAVDMPRWVPPARMFEPMESMGGAVELAREVWGLGIMAVWMLLVLYLGRHREPRKAVSAAEVS